MKWTERDTETRQKRTYRDTESNVISRDEDPTFFSTDPDPAQREKDSVSGSDLKSKRRKNVFIF